VDDDTLILCATINGQEHLIAIAARRTISEIVSDHLITKGNNEVLRTISGNPGVRISDPSFSTLVDRSADDDCLAEAVAKRVDIPEQHLRELISKASEIVRQRLLADAPELSKIIREIMPEGTPADTSETSAFKDYRTAELVVRSQMVSEAAVVEFAKAKRLEEVIVSIAQLSGLSVAEIERLFMETWSSPVAVILKAIGFHLATLEAIYRARLSNGYEVRGDLSKIKAEFIGLRRPTAERILRFYCARKAAKGND
jgi:Uncharacterised protein conserved in bacteria (DUF2336)